MHGSNSGGSEHWDFKKKPMSWIHASWQWNFRGLNLLEITWKQARNATLKVHEMEQLY